MTGYTYTTHDRDVGVAFPLKHRTHEPTTRAATRAKAFQQTEKQSKAFTLFYPASCCAIATGFGLLLTGTGTRGN